MKKKSIKNILLSFFASCAFGVLWLVIMNLVDVARVNNYELIVYVGFVVASISIAMLFSRKDLKQTESNMLKKIICFAIVTILSFAVMVASFYTAVFFGLTYLH